MVVEHDDQARLLTIHSLTDGRFDLQVKLLDLLADQLELIQFCDEVSFILDVVMGTPIGYLSLSHLVNCIVH